MADILVVGGGISGLTAALLLHRAGHSIRLLEAGEEAGGNLKTLRQDGFQYERGPNGITASSEEVFKLVTSLGLEEHLQEASSAASARFVVRDGSLHEAPSSLRSFLSTGLLSWKGKGRLALEPFIGRGGEKDETAWEFFVRRFGVEAASYLMSPFISGIYAGDIHRLGARAAFPKFWGFEQESGSMIRGAMGYMKAKKERLQKAGLPQRRGLYSFRNGLSELPQTICKELGGRVECGVSVRELSYEDGKWVAETSEGERSASHLLLATPPQVSASLLQGTFPSLAQELLQIPMAKVAVVHWHCDEHPQIPHGFGFLVPPQEPYRVMGTIFSSDVFEGRTETGQRLFSSFYGGAFDEEILSLSDEEMLSLVRKEHEQLWGVTLDPALLQVFRYQHAIPQLLPQHPELRTKIEGMTLELPGLVLAGNYLSGVSIDHAVASGYRASDSMTMLLSNGN